MKKKYIIAIILIVIGLITCLLTYPKTNFKYTDQFGVNEPAVLEYETYILDEFDSIEISEDVSGIEIIKSDENKVVFHENPKHQHSITIKEGTLKIGYRKDLNLTLINPDDGYSIAVYTKENNLKNLKIKTEYGYIRLYSGLNFDKAEIETSTGSIFLEDNAINSLEAEVITGNIEARNLKGNEISLETTAGNISIDKAEVNELEIESQTGNITFSDIDAKDIEIENTAGDIKGSIISDMNFKASSLAGLVEVPESKGNNHCKITNKTGNILITK